mmetsp:Transcript_29320/g.69318  ORF Transcript_29320/g.69318 Transcript_29320/m.69318 type:complete len:204 (+) Transcript_29320:296-907(+)
MVHHRFLRRGVGIRARSAAPSSQAPVRRRAIGGGCSGHGSTPAGAEVALLRGSQRLARALDLRHPTHLGGPDRGRKLGGNRDHCSCPPPLRTASVRVDAPQCHALLSPGAWSAPCSGRKRRGCTQEPRWRSDKGRRGRVVGQAERHHQNDRSGPRGPAAPPRNGSMHLGARAPSPWSIRASHPAPRSTQRRGPAQKEGCAMGM